MSEAPKETKNESDPGLIFSEIEPGSLEIYRELFRNTTYHNSLQEFIRDWADEKGFDEETGWKRISKINSEDLSGEQREEKEKMENERNEFLVRVYIRTHAVIKYANQVVNADTDNYRDPKDKKFHKDLIEKSAEIETNWDLRTNEDWKNKIREDIDHRIFEYTKAKPND